jgi:hypothetical protein
MCSSSDTEEFLAESLRKLTGAQLINSHLGADGCLVLTWNTGAQLELQPDNWLISPDYYLDFGWAGQQPQLYYRFGGEFAAYPPPDYEESI